MTLTLIFWGVLFSSLGPIKLVFDSCCLQCISVSFWAVWVIFLPKPVLGSWEIQNYQKFFKIWYLGWFSGWFSGQFEAKKQTEKGKFFLYFWQSLWVLELFYTKTCPGELGNSTFWDFFQNLTNLVNRRVFRVYFQEDLRRNIHMNKGDFSCVWPICHSNIEMQQV